MRSLDASVRGRGGWWRVDAWSWPLAGARARARARTVVRRPTCLCCRWGLALCGSVCSGMTPDKNRGRRDGAMRHHHR